MRIQDREDAALADRLRPAIDEALALEVLGRIDLHVRPRYPEAARAVGAAADDLDVEAFRLHLTINVRARVVLAELYAGSVSLQSFLDDILNGGGLGVCALVGMSKPCVVVW